MAAYEGLDVRFVTDDGQFRGILHSLDGISKKITLRKVTCLDTGKCFPGLLNFYGHEIILLEVLEDGIQKADKASSELKKPSQSYGLLSNPEEVRGFVSKSRGQRNQGASILDRHESPKHLKNLRDYDPEKEVLSKKSATEGTADTDTDLKFGTLTVKFGEHDKEYNVDYTLIDTADHVYRAAIGCIKQQKFIAVNMEGVLIGRRGKICIVQVATRQHVYLFDILQLGFACFNQGLGEIFESKDIVKVKC
ncbi:piRNA biogenesis protein EXD1-like [Glandiceps talaboti]